MADEYPEKLPRPLTPEYCVIRNPSWFPMYGNRLYNSDFDAAANDAEFRAAQRLWWCAFNQEPAASLPNNDNILCKLAGLGKDLKTWSKVKTMALHGFILCSDGRLYHSFLAEVVLESYSQMLKKDQHRKKDRERLAAWREAKKAKRAGGLDIQPTDQVGHETSEETLHETRFEPSCEMRPETPDETSITLHDTTTHHKICSDASHPPPAGAVALPDVRKQLFDEGVPALMGLIGRREGAVRAYIGKCLKELRDDAGELLSIIREAVQTPPANPSAWISAAVKARSVSPDDDFANGVLEAAGLKRTAAGITIDHAPSYAGALI